MTSLLCALLLQSASAQKTFGEANDAYFRDHHTAFNVYRVDASLNEEPGVTIRRYSAGC